MRRRKDVFPVRKYKVFSSKDRSISESVNIDSRELKGLSKDEVEDLVISKAYGSYSKLRKDGKIALDKVRLISVAKHPKLLASFTDYRGRKGKIGDIVFHFMIYKYGSELYTYSEAVVEDIINQGRYGYQLTLRCNDEVYNNNYCFTDRGSNQVIVQTMRLSYENE